MKTHQTRGATLLFALLGAQAMATEQPKYQVVHRHTDFEVRDYAPVIAAETEVDGDPSEAGNRAFRLLAGYIFGGNQGTKKIAMTAPVVQEPVRGTRIAMTAPVVQAPGDGTRWTVQFSMPSEWSLESLPKPNDARVTLRQLPSRRVAVLRYSGTWSTSNYQKHLEALLSGLAREGYAAQGTPRWARYNPPWTPWFLRTNEVHIEVASRPQATSDAPAAGDGGAGETTPPTPPPSAP